MGKRKVKKKKVVTCDDVVDVDEVLDMTTRTAEHLNLCKKRGVTTKVITVDSLLSYSDKLGSMCKRVKDLEKDNTILKQRIKKLKRHNRNNK